MAQHQVVKFTISQSNFDAMKDGLTGVTVQINYHDDAPAGYEIVLIKSDTANVAVCPRPCTSLTLPQF